MKKEKFRNKLRYYKEKKKDIIQQIKEIDRRYKEGYIDLQLYYETLLRNFGTNPKDIIAEYNKKIDFYTKGLSSIHETNKKIFLTIIISLFLISMVLLSFRGQITGFQVGNDIIIDENTTINETQNTEPNNADLLENVSQLNETVNETKDKIVNETETEIETNATEENTTIIKKIVDTPEEGYSEEESYERPILGELVKWVKKVKKEKEGESKVEIPKEAKDIEVTKKEKGGKSSGGITGAIGLEIETQKKEASKSLLQKIISFLKKIFTNKAKITGKVTEEVLIREDAEKRHLILTTPGEYEVIYYTPPATATEERISSYGKKVVVSGPDLSYTNILTSTTIPELISLQDKEFIKIFWKEENKYVDFQLEDTNNNELADKITWITEHLSNQTFEISITIINVQSFPTVGGNWEVQFTTTGIANLTIKTVEGTTWDNTAEDKDLKFLEVRCGSNLLAYEWVDNMVFINDYNCDETGYETSFVITEGKHVLEFDFGGIKRYARNFAVGRRTGMLAYGESTVQIPRYRIWNGTTFSSELNANSVGGTIEWLRLKASPTRDEYIIVTADAFNDVNIQINSSLGGASCWHNGTACNTVLELTTTSTGINRLKADVAYEQRSGDALVVFSDNTNVPKYRTWNGTTWSAQANVPQTLITGGVISYVKMASHPQSDEIALIMTNTTALNVIIWNGTAWNCQPPSLRSSVLTPDVFQHADIAYEQVSGDLFVASSVNGITEVDYTTKLNGTCSFTTARTTTLLEEGEILSIAPQYGSNYIMTIQEDIGGNDMHAIIWNGSVMQATSGNEISLYAEASPNLLIASGWAGKSKRGVLVYSDAATSLNLDYMLYNTTENAWEGGTSGLDATGITSFSSEEENIQTYSFYEDNKLLVIIQDELDDLWAKIYNADSNSWSNADNGIPLEAAESSPEFPSFDFTWTLFEINQPPNITFYSPSMPNVNLLENSTRNVSVTFLVTDTNGMANINESTAFVEFTKAGEQTRDSIPGSCTKTFVDAISVNVTCNVTMFFYDANGTWNMSVSTSDNILVDQDNTTFEVNLLSSIAILAPLGAPISFPGIDPESTSLQATNDPLIIKNIGNHEGSIVITAYDLFGITTQADKITASNFAASAISGEECTGTVLANATDITITGSILLKGPSETKETYYCLQQIPNVIAQEYSTSAPGSLPWSIRILLVSFIPRKRKQKRLKDTSALKIIAQSIAKIERLSKEHHINITDVINFSNSIKKEAKKIIIPLSIFSKEVGMLEALCKYLKDHCKMRYSEIAKILKRDDRTVWTSYTQATKKEKEINKKFDAKVALIGIPLIELQKENLSILESIVIYLRKSNYRYSEIAFFLKRDERNIWTASKRAEKKIKE